MLTYRRKDDFEIIIIPTTLNVKKQKQTLRLNLCNNM